MFYFLLRGLSVVILLLSMSVLFGKLLIKELSFEYIFFVSVGDFDLSICCFRWF